MVQRTIAHVATAENDRRGKREGKDELPSNLETHYEAGRSWYKSVYVRHHI